MDEPKYCFIQFKFSYNTKLGKRLFKINYNQR